MRELFLVFGLAGSGLVVLAYLLNQTGRWNLPSALIEVFWVAISLFGLARCRRA